MSQYTKGPWRVIDATRGYIIGNTNFPYDIAVVRAIGNENNAANARLIAAAPELLEALEDMVSAKENGDWLGNSLNKARAAIAKAKE